MVIVILGILAVVAIPRYFDLQKQSELGVAKQFDGALKEAASHYLEVRVLGNNPLPSTHTFNKFVGLTEPGSALDLIVINRSITLT